MRSQNLNIAELIQFQPGRVGLQGRRLLIHDLSALGQFRRDLIETVGEKMARRILTRKGFFWGQADAAGMQRLYTWDCLEEWLLAGAELLKISGKAQAEMKIEALNESSGLINVRIVCTDSAEVEQHLSEMGKAAAPVCWVLAGYASGYFSYCLGKSVYFVEKKCQAADSPICELIGKDIDSWGTDIEKDLPFFLAVDIQKKVRELTVRIRDQQRTLTLQRKQIQATRNIKSLFGFEIRSKAFRNVLELAERVAGFDTTVLITGETGTGKEVLARHIHALSARNKGPFLAINCSALPDSLLESELFGHRAGSFTGAVVNKTGLFKAAEKGTIFLDEIGDISPALQAKLLQVLQSKEIRPVGDTRSQAVDVRVISATNHDLDQLVIAGTFRKDLLYRLRVINIEIPPLRERLDDILPLARFFLSIFQRRLKIQNLRLAPATMDVLMKYPWPGNVRELENTLEHASVLCTDGIISPEILPVTVTEMKPLKLVCHTKQTLGMLEMQHIGQVLESTGGKRSAAAKILGISESTLYRRIRGMAV